MRYLIFDSETQTHTSHKRKANPFHPDNYVVLRGWKHAGDKHCMAQRFKSKTQDNYLRIADDVNILVGHNIKFDLLYEMCNDNPDLKAFFKRGGKIWCTQYAEYLLQAQAQTAQMCSMDSIVEKYGGRTKVDGIKELWNAGVQTSDIDPALLLDYLVGTKAEGRNSGDIGNTELIYLGQLQDAKEAGMLTAIERRMDGLASTTDMEYNGIKVDVKRAGKNLKRLTKELEEVTADLDQYINHIPEEVGFNWASGTHASCIIFGGTIKYKKSDTYIDPDTGELARLKAKEAWPLFGGDPMPPDECTVVENPLYDGVTYEYGGQPQDRYLSGKKKNHPKTKQVDVPGELKTKIQDFFYTLDGYTKPDPEWKGKLTDGNGDPIYSTNADVVERISKRGIPFLVKLGRLQALNKEIGTYYVRYDERTKKHTGMLTCVQKWDHIVHPSLNHVNTVTTRLSANNPNGQNMPRGDKSDLKAIFTSRFGEDGSMIEADYSQLEVVVQGVLSRDKQLCEDLRNRIDFHCKRVSAKYDIPYEDALVWCKDEEKSPDFAKWKGRRTEVKEFSFQRAYGAGAAAISDSTGIDVEEVKELIRLEELMYPGLGTFNAAVEAEVNATAEPFTDGSRGWRTFRRGTWQAPTGTLYNWRSYDAPAWMRKKGIVDTFKPTELKNYPVQGTGGEIVQLILGLLWRWFVKMDNFGGKAFLVNTVHDCVWVDVHNDVKETVAHGIKVIMESVPQQLKKYYGMKCTVPFPVEVEGGPNMLDLHHI